MKTTKIIKYKKPGNKFIEDLIVTMFEGGSNYWIDHIHADPPKTKGIPTSIWASNIVNKGGTVYVYPIDEKKGYGLTKQKMLKGIQMWVERHPKQVYMDAGEIDEGSMDAGVADTILQYTLFGKLVFG